MYIYICIYIYIYIYVYIYIYIYIYICTHTHTHTRTHTYLGALPGHHRAAQAADVRPGPADARRGAAGALAQGALVAGGRLRPHGPRLRRRVQRALDRAAGQSEI